MLGFSNREDLLKSSELSFASRIKEEDSKLFLKSARNKRRFGSDKGDFLNFHVFDEKGNYVDSLLGIEQWNNNLTIAEEKTIISLHEISLNPVNDAKKLNIIPGRYKGCYNFFNKTLWGYEDEAMFLQEISPSREEARLKLKNVPDIIKKNFVLFGRIDDSELKANSGMVLDFGKNLNFLVINWFLDEINDPEYPHSLLVKFYEPLPDAIKENSFCWLFQEISDSIVFSFEIPIEKPKDDYLILRGPNFNVSSVVYEQGSDYMTYDKALPAQENVKSYLLENYIESEKFLEKVNVDYKNFENFCFFSSAERRIEIFIQKAEILKNIEDRIAHLSSSMSSSSFVFQEKIELERKRSEILTSLDDYERFLFNEKNQFIKINGMDFDVAPPKITATKPHKLVSTDSSQFFDWKRKILAFAKDYDATNPNLLRKYLPYHVLDDIENEHFLRFVDMIGHHFDLLWLNIKSMASLYDVGNRYDEKLGGDVAYFVAKSLGLNLFEGKDFARLIEYILGKEATGIGETYMPYLKISREIWKRLINNISYILKTKGTEKSIRALLNCFGIPASVLKIKEFGKSQTARRKKTQKIDYFRNSLKLNGSQSVIVPWINFKDDAKPRTIQFRFKTSLNSTREIDDRGEVLLERNGLWGIQIKKADQSSPSSFGEINFILSGSNGYASASLKSLPLFNGEWWNVMLRLSSSVGWTETMPMKYELVCKCFAFNRMIFERSGSLMISGSAAADYNRSYHETGSGDVIRIGGFASSSFGRQFIGNVQEFRLWSSALNDVAFDNYASSAGLSYEGNSTTASLSELLVRYSFNKTKDHFENPLINDSNPGKIKYNATASGFVSGSKHYDQEILKSIFKIPSSGIESHVGIGASDEIETFDASYLIDENGAIRLFWNERLLKINKEKNKDSHDKIGVYFSISNIINEDIIAFLGSHDLGDYLGNPEYFYESEYKELRILRKKYFEARMNFVSQWTSYLKALYLYDKNMFSLIHSLTPERSKKVVGIVVEQDALEAPKIKFHPITANGLKLEKSIDGFFSKIESDRENLETKLEKAFKEIKTDVLLSLKGEIDGNSTEIQGKIEREPIAHAKTIEKKAEIAIDDKSAETIKEISRKLIAEASETEIRKKIEKTRAIEILLENESLRNIDAKQKKEIKASIEEINISEKMEKTTIMASTSIEWDAWSIAKGINGEKKKTYAHKWNKIKLDEFYSNWDVLTNSIKDFSQLKKEIELKKNETKWWRRKIIEKKKKNWETIDGKGFEPVTTIYLTNRKNLAKNRLFYEGCRQVGNEDLPKEKWTTPNGMPVVTIWPSSTEKALVNNRGIGDAESNLRID